MNHIDYLQSKFENLDLVNSSFHELPLSLHIKLQDKFYQLDDQGEINLEYFKKVYDSAINMFDELFNESDVLYLVTVVRSEKPLTKPLGLYSKFTSKSNNYRLKTFKEFDEDGQTIQFSLETRKKDIAYKKMIKAICNQDFKELTPRFTDKLVTYPEVFFINKDKGLIFHIYDDRGAFILFNDEKVHKDFNIKYSTLLRRE